MLDIRFCSATDPASESSLDDLNQQLSVFYAGEQMRSYYSLAHSQNIDWSEKRYHRLIRHICGAGMEVLDLGCGSAHGYVNLENSGVRYLGIDWSEEQIQRNRTDLAPAAQFRAASLYNTGLASDRFHVVFSLFTLEHLVFPHRFLSEALRVTAPEGQLIILCPNFRPSGRIPSLDYGGSIAPLKEKIRSGKVRESAYHLFLRSLYYPVLIARKFPRSRYPFLINLAPTCLKGAYYPDNVAVYFVDRDEVRDELIALGSEDITPQIVKGNDGPSVCFVVVWKQPRGVTTANHEGNTSQTREEQLFLDGYGNIEMNQLAFAYYRYEWCVQEIGDFGNRIFLSKEISTSTKQAAVQGFKKLFSHGDVIEAALHTPFEAEQRNRS